MITTLFTIWVVFAFVKLATSAASKMSRHRPQKQLTSARSSQTQIITIKQLQAQRRQHERERRQQEAEHQRQIKEAERAARERERAEMQAEKLRQKKQQAEADIAFLTEQQDQIVELLIINDKALEKIALQIEIDRATRSYDAETKDNKQREKLIKKKMEYETRLHSIEKRIAAAHYTINT